MGNGESAHLNSRLTKTQVFDQIRPQGALSYSYFRQEHVISAFYHSSVQAKQEEQFSCPHQPSQLTSLLLGCYEQLDNIPDIIQTIIKLCQEKENDNVIQLSHSFNLYDSLATARSVMIFTIQQFSPLLFTPFTEYPAKEGVPVPDFTQIMETFRICNEAQFKSFSKYPEFDQVAAHYHTCSPATAFPPPTPEFIPKLVGHTELFSAKYVFAHGTATSGQFLFVLCTDILQIFPLFNMGSLITPISRRLDINVDSTISLTADKTSIYIYKGENVYEYKIFDVFKKKDKLAKTISKIPPDYICYVSDGVVKVRLDIDNFATVYENNKVVRKVKLVKGNEPLNPQIPMLFPRVDYSKIPIETNGTFLSFMFRINPTTVIYRVFSLITGKFVHDDLFRSSDYYCSAATDSINRCHWVTSLFDNNKLGVRRYYFAGSINPSFVGLPGDRKTKSKKKYKMFIHDMFNVVIHYLGSQVIPKAYMASSDVQVYDIIQMTRTYLNIPKQDIAVQILVIILELNMKKIRATPDFREKILDLVHLLPLDLSVFLYFNTLNIVLFEQTKRSIDMLITLIEKIQDDVQITYALSKLESCSLLASISFSQENKLTKLLPSDTCSESSISPILHSILLIHQRVLITMAAQFIRNDKFEDIQFQSNKELSTPLDYLNDYSNQLLTKFQKSLANCQDYNELDQSLILSLLYNFLNLLSSLSSYHVVAQFLTESFSGLLQKINDFIEKKSINLESESNLNNILRLFLFVYGKLSATLLKGTAMTDFEKHFVHFIRNNLKISHKVTNDNLKGVESKILKFLNDSSVSDPIMDLVYKKFKPFMHKNLSPELKELDKLSLAAASKHLHATNDLLKLKFPFSAKIKPAMDQMLKIRNAYRSLQQQPNSVNEIKLKCKMLLKMNSNEDTTPAEIGDFVSSKETTSTIIKLLMRQNTRAKLTDDAFSFVNSVLSLDKYNLFADIFTFTLSQVQNFEGLASILKITGSASQNNIKELFSKILKIIRNRKQSRLILVSCRFFRDCAGLINEAQNAFLNGILSIFCENDDNYSLFALALSLMDSVNEIPEPLKQPKQSAMGRLLQYACFSHVQVTPEFYASFRNEFWNCPPELKRILCRVMFAVINSKLLDKNDVKKELVLILKTIGKYFIEFSDIKTANELIWLLRRIITENTEVKPILLNIFENVDHKDDVIVCGIFATLGNSMESVRPFCNIKYHSNRSSVSEYIAAPTNVPTTFLCYERPFNINRPALNRTVSPQNLIYAVSVVKLDIQTFNDFDYILSFYDEIFKNLASIKAVLYVQVLSHFLQYSEFISKFTTDMITKLANSPLPFHTIYLTIANVRNMQPLAGLPQVDGFNQVEYSSNKFTSYISPQIKPKTKFTVKFVVPKDTQPIYFGIISDNVERFFTRFSLVSCPFGVWYPYNNHIVQFKDLSNVSFDVDSERFLFTVEGQELEFPRGETFRVLIAIPKVAQIKINIVNSSSSSSPFDIAACPSICPHGAINAGSKSLLYTIPSQLKGQIKENYVPSDINKFPTIKSVVEPLPTGYKVKNNFNQPPDYISIHCGFATNASFQIVAENIRGLFKTIALQFTTVCLMRIAAQEPTKIPNPMKLFTLLTIPLEPFSFDLFKCQKFPFTFENIRRNPNSLYLSLENEAIQAIEALLSVEKIVDRLCKCMLNISESRNMHLLSYPHVNHTYYPPLSYFPPISLKKMPSIVTINSFMPIRFSAASADRNPKKENLPFAFGNYQENLYVDQSITKEDLSVLSVNVTDNSFAFDTAFELLMDIKNVSFHATTPQQKFLIKSAFANLCIAQSPFVYNYLYSFSEFLGVILAPTPLDYSPKYMEKLFIMGGTLKGSNCHQFEVFEPFIQQESAFLGSDLYIEIIKHFPEFLSFEPERPLSRTCTVPIVSLDPGTIKSNFAQHIRMIRLFSIPYKSLVNFPFLQILPYWLRVTGAWRSSKNSQQNKKSRKSSSGSNNGDASGYETDEIDPFAEATTPDVMHISNPTGQKITIQLRMNKQVVLSNSSMLMLSTTPDFENAVFVNGRALFGPIEIKGQHQFLALIDVPGGWSVVRVEFTSWKRYRPPPPEKIDIDSIHDAFIADMTEFAINWTSENTEELIMDLPRYSLTEPTFVSAESIAKTCHLTHLFSTSVVVLRALLIHHFNYIRTRYYDQVPRILWDSMKSFVACEDAADGIIRDIACGNDNQFPRFKIDRHAARRYAVEHRGDYNKSIVTQLSVAFRSIEPNLLQCKKRPWKIEFVGERAVDAGGPSRELMTEMAASIFDPTTQLFIPVPNSKANEGANKDTFIPLDRTFRRAEDYLTIGKYLGIVLRTGLTQDLPFAPLVWKYFAHEKIDANDIYDIDTALQDQMKIVPQQCEQGTLTWTFHQWEGDISYLPGHSANQVVRVEEAQQYIHEVIQCRIDAIKPMMKMMRNGFSQNVGFKKHPLMTGKLLSRIAQGSSFISTEHLKSITVVADYDGMKDVFVQRFWRVVDKFTSEQRKLLLKFITTLTRLPNPVINPDFRLQIDKMNTKTPDESLPTASTCFNRLHLPAYSNDDICAEKVIYAITYCQSMENK